MPSTDPVMPPAREPDAGARPRWAALVPDRAVVPGLAAVAVAAALAFGIEHLVSGFGAPTAAVVLGALVANLGLQRPVLVRGTKVASTRLLRIAVVLLGLQLSVPQLLDLGVGGLVVVVVTVAVTFVGTQLIGRALGVPPARALLVATGFSVCGASAVAAMQPVARGKEEDTSVAIALVTLCGSLAIVLLPLLRVPLGLDVPAFGAWVGASVHDVGQTVATASRVPGALETAVVVKLTRVVLLAPLVAVVAVTGRRRDTRDGVSAAAGRRPPLVPLFVVGFLVAVALTSTGVLPASMVAVAHALQTVLLVAALYALGTGIRVKALVATGGSSLVLGLTSWVLVAGVAYAGVRLLGL